MLMHSLRAVALFCMLAVLFATGLSGCKKQPSPPCTEFVFGTVCSINLFESGTPELYALLFARLYELEHLFSINLPDSEISRINAASGIEPVVVSPEVIRVLEIVCEYAAKTDGAFDPSAGPLVKLWNIGSGEERVPSQAEIDAVLPLVDYRNIRIDKAASSVFLAQKGMVLDLGAAVKGYAADELVAILDHQSVTHVSRRAIIDLGGNVYVFGSKNADTPWRVGIKNPYEPDSAPALFIEAADKSVVTSGVYERFFEYDGKRYHHIFDTKTGYPVKNGICSFSIVSDSSFKADILSTSAFALGIKDGLRFVASVFGAEGVCIDEYHQFYTTEGLDDSIHVLNNQFKKKKPE